MTIGEELREAIAAYLWMTTAVRRARVARSGS